MHASRSSSLIPTPSRFAYLFCKITLVQCAGGRRTRDLLTGYITRRQFAHRAPAFTGDLLIYKKIKTTRSKCLRKPPATDRLWPSAAADSRWTGVGGLKLRAQYQNPDRHRAPPPACGPALICELMNYSWTSRARLSGAYAKCSQTIFYVGSVAMGKKMSSYGFAPRRLPECHSLIKRFKFEIGSGSESQARPGLGLRASMRSIKEGNASSAGSEIGNKQHADRAAPIAEIKWSLKGMRAAPALGCVGVVKRHASDQLCNVCTNARNKASQSFGRRLGGAEGTARAQPPVTTPGLSTLCIKRSYGVPCKIAPDNASARLDSNKSLCSANDGAFNECYVMHFELHANNAILNAHILIPTQEAGDALVSPMGFIDTRIFTVQVDSGILTSRRITVTIPPRLTNETRLRTDTQIDYHQSSARVNLARVARRPPDYFGFKAP
ncbi:hypothetical protein EVAR_62684_1 [Eumeta japonica]|uniref:Uncharacterized protein n=1 Tax=Eumeta variegata TaxID=151549 RepID=A0A4C1ZUN0_EUMVA|nr:hypothetical protein EVAR_62684_1 [Eumeta japonica]